MNSAIDLRMNISWDNASLYSPKSPNIFDSPLNADVDLKFFENLDFLNKEINEPVIISKKRTEPEFEENKNNLEKTNVKTIRKGRKPKTEYGLTIDQIREERAAKNRIFAKESRERKKAYIIRLEKENEELRRELKEHKEIFGKYEIIERQRSKLDCELYTWIHNANKAMKEMNLSIFDNRIYAKQLEKEASKYIKERCKALEELTKIILELAMPTTVRISHIDSSKKYNDGDDYIPPIEIMKSTDNNISLDEAKKISKYIQSIYPTLEDLKNFIGNIERSSEKIKGWMKELLICQKKSQAELKQLYQCKFSTAFKKFNFESVTALAELTMYVSNKPEYSNYAVYQIKEKDFGADDLYLTEEASIMK